MDGNAEQRQVVRFVANDHTEHKTAEERDRYDLQAAWSPVISVYVAGTVPEGEAPGRAQTTSERNIREFVAAMVGAGHLRERPSPTVTAADETAEPAEVSINDENAGGEPTAIKGRRRQSAAA